MVFSADERPPRRSLEPHESGRRRGHLRACDARKPFARPDSITGANTLDRHIAIRRRDERAGDEAREFVGPGTIMLRSAQPVRFLGGVGDGNRAVRPSKAPPTWL